MKFGVFALDACEGAILAHSLRTGKLVLRKGHHLSSGDLSALREVGIERLTVAIGDADDIGEDEAAQRIAASLSAGGCDLSNAGTGRVNLHAACSGVMTTDRDLVDAINAIDPGITFATLNHLEPVRTGRMVATVKIIPYFVPRAAVEAAEAIAREPAILTVHPYRAHRVAMISTRLAGMKQTILTKTERVLEARLAPSGSSIVSHDVVDHDARQLESVLGQRRAGADMVIVFGASAISDDLDVIPDALRSAGGTVERLGMPVDPGNLLMLGSLDGKPVIGAPGCARAPSRNGFDFVLERLLSGIGVSGSDIAGMGVGGLLMEIASRPQPREAAVRNQGGEVSLAAIVLAAGQSRRMGRDNKLTLDWKGKPMVRHVIDAAKNADAVDSVLVVTGHEADAVRAAAGDGVSFVHNPAYEEGLSASLRTGIEALPPTATHAIILLGDMPQVTAAMLDQMAAALGGAQAESRIVMATSNGKRGNPVIWPRAHFEALAAISGDTGARHLIGQHRDAVIEVEIGDAGALDVDTPEAYHALGV